MSRRDTIIIAVLINAGLLMVLFATAMPSKEEEPTSSPEESKLIELAAKEDPIQKNVHPLNARDEVDQVLSEWNIKPGSVSLDDGASKTTPIAFNYESTTPSDSASATTAAKDPSDNPTTLTEIEAPAKKAVNSNESYKTITVKKGDVLERLAKNNGTTVSEIMRINDLANGKLKIGQELKVPSKGTSAQSTASSAKKSKTASATTKAASTTSSEAQYYTVKSGDSPWLIANKNHIKLEDLLKLNNLNDDKARKLKPGDKIRIK